MKEVNSRSGLLHLVEGGRKSALAQSAKTLIAQPAKGVALYAGYNFLHRLRPEKPQKLDQFFSPPIREERTQRALEDLPEVLGSIQGAVAGSSETLRTVPKELAQDWSDTRLALQQELGEGNTVTNYVLYKPEGMSVYYIHDTNLISSLTFTHERSIRQTIYEQTRQPISVPINYQKPMELHQEGASELPSVQAAIAIEDGIAEMEEHPGYGENFSFLHTQLVRVSGGTNSFDLRRHRDFEREGTVISQIVKEGATSVGELQTILSLLPETVGYDRTTNTVTYDEDIAEAWKNIQPSITNDETLRKFMNEIVYFRFMTQYFNEKPELVTSFVHSDIYSKYADIFRNTHIAAFGQTEKAVATAMLAGFYLYQFEGSGNPVDSPSQQLLAQTPLYHQAIEEFLIAQEVLTPSKPVCLQATEQKIELAILAGQLKTVPLTPYSFSRIQKREVIRGAVAATERSYQERRRFSAGRQLLSAVEAHTPLIVDRDKPPAALGEIVGNVILARVPHGNTFTASKILRADGYMPPPSEELPKIPRAEEVPSMSVESALRYVLNGEDNGGDKVVRSDKKRSKDAFDAQLVRLFKVAPVILQFLELNDLVPQNIRDFIGKINSPEFPITVLEQFSGLDSQDPLIVSRFYNDTIEAFQSMLQHRYVVDFIRGVETELIGLTQPSRRKMARKILPLWRNNDFSGVSDNVLEEAIGSTLAFGEHRLKKLNNEETDSWYLKDRQEGFETANLWDTNGMKFLRWGKHAKAINYFGINWHCMCYYRKTLFNNVIPQY